MRKLFTLAAMLLLMVVSANATKTYVDLSTKITHPSTYSSNNARWDSENNKLFWKSSSNCVVQIPGLTGDLSNYTSIFVKTSGLTEGAKYRVIINAGGGNYVAYLEANGSFDLPITGDNSKFGKQWDGTHPTTDLLKNVTYVGIAGNSNPGDGVEEVSIKFESFAMVEPTKVTFDDDGVCSFDFSDIKSSGTASFDESTGVLTSTGIEGWLQIDFDKSYDLSAIKTWKIDGTSDLFNNWSLTGVTKKSDESALDMYSGATSRSFGSGQTVNPTDYDMTAVTGIKLHVTKEGTSTINSFKLTAEVMTCSNEALVKSLKDLQYYTIDGTTASATWNVGTSSDCYYGSGSSDPTNYVDLTDYAELRIYRDDQTDFRAFFINKDKSGTNKITKDNECVTWNATDKYFTIDLSKIEKYQNKVYLNTIKSSGWGVNNVVNKIEVLAEAKYRITGSGIQTPSTVDALANSSVTYIDATGVTGTNVTLTSANPNCIFKANDGVLANENNVMVDGTIANLALTDGYPFAVPTGATATAASYTRAASGTYGTICLPYAVSSNDAVQYYTLGANNGTTLTIETVATVAAGTPAIFRNISGSDLTVAGSGALAANVNGSASTGTVLTLKGTYEKKSITDATELAKIYYISGEKVMQATSSLTVNPFRAYMEATTSGSAKSYNLFEADETTAINAIFNSENSDVKVAEIYSINGAKQNELQKGINIVKFSNGTSKKVILK